MQTREPAKYLQKHYSSLKQHANKARYAIQLCADKCRSGHERTSAYFAFVQLCYVLLPNPVHFWNIFLQGYKRFVPHRVQGGCDRVTPRCTPRCTRREKNKTKQKQRRPFAGMCSLLFCTIACWAFGNVFFFSFPVGVTVVCRFRTMSMHRDQSRGVGSHTSCTAVAFQYNSLTHGAQVPNPPRTKTQGTSARNGGRRRCQHHTGNTARRKRKQPREPGLAAATIHPRTNNEQRIATTSYFNHHTTTTVTTYHDLYHTTTRTPQRRRRRQQQHE